MTALYADALIDQYFQEIGESVGLPASTEADLAAQVQAGDDQALTQLVEANLRFVVQVAKQYQHLGLPLADLISEGNLGLVTAARRFDGTKGYKFISYAVWWIKQAILDALATQTRTVRLPHNRIDQLQRLNKVLSPLEQRLGRPPEVDEIADAMAMSPEEIDLLLQLALRPVCLDAPLEEDVNQYYGEVLADDSCPVVDDDLWAEGLEHLLQAALHRLNEREAQVVRHYYGLQGYEARNRAQIGALLGCSRERVRQILELALNKLRHRTHTGRLRAYHDDIHP